MFPSSTKREIRHFHVVVVQRRLRNAQKSVMHVHSCYFVNLNLLVFCRSRYRRRRRCLSSLIFMGEDWDLGHQTLSANPSGTMFDVCERLVPVLCCCCSYLPVLDNFSCRPEKQSGIVWTYPNSEVGVPVLILEFLERSMQIALTKLLLIHHAIQLILCCVTYWPPDSITTRGLTTKRDVKKRLQLLISREHLTS